MNNTINVSIDCVPAALREFFAEHSTIALAFSGGTDSSYLLYAAKACGANVHAYYVSTPFQPQFELDDAKLLAESLHADMTVLPFDVLTDKVVKSNPKDRCYYCKNQVFGGILKAAKEDGFTEIMDGTNASDDADDRPGMRASRCICVGREGRVLCNRAGGAIVLGRICARRAGGLQPPCPSRRCRKLGHAAFRSAYTRCAQGAGKPRSVRDCVPVSAMVMKGKGDDRT